jgi:hypothetical protein
MSEDDKPVRQVDSNLAQNSPRLTAEFTDDSESTVPVFFHSAAPQKPAAKRPHRPRGEKMAKLNADLAKVHAELQLADIKLQEMKQERDNLQQLLDEAYELMKKAETSIQNRTLPKAKKLYGDLCSKQARWSRRNAIKKVLETIFQDLEDFSSVHVVLANRTHRVELHVKGEAEAQTQVRACMHYFVCCSDKSHFISVLKEGRSRFYPGKLWLQFNSFCTNFEGRSLLEFYSVDQLRA